LSPPNLKGQSREQKCHSPNPFTIYRIKVHIA
jgi:hypothetical protein